MAEEPTPEEIDDVAWEIVLNARYHRQHGRCAHCDTPFRWGEELLTCAEGDGAIVHVDCLGPYEQAAEEAS